MFFDLIFVRLKEFTASGQAFACPKRTTAAQPVSRAPRRHSDSFLKYMANSGWVSAGSPHVSMTWATVEGFRNRDHVLLANAPVQRKPELHFWRTLSNSTEKLLESTALDIARPVASGLYAINRDSVLLQYSSSPPSMVLSIRLNVLIGCDSLRGKCRLRAHQVAARRIVTPMNLTLPAATSSSILASAFDRNCEVGPVELVKIDIDLC